MTRTLVRMLFDALHGVAIVIAACFAAEPFVPYGFEIPVADDLKPVPRLEPIVPMAASTPSAEPLDASVVVMCKGANGHNTIGSGTVVDSESGTATILTCMHLFRGLQSPSISVIHHEKMYVGTLGKVDEKSDLAVVSVKADLPAVALADDQPTVGDRVTTVGLDESGKAVVAEGRTITAVDKYEQPRNFESDGDEWLGRSGGGLFFNGALCGVIQARRPDSRRGIYIAIEPIRELLRRGHQDGEKCAAEQHRAAVTDVELWKAPLGCPSCEIADRNFGDGTPRIRVKRYVAPTTWHPSEGEFPYTRIKDASGKWHLLYGITTLEQLERNIDLLNKSLQGQKSPFNHR